MKRLLSTLAILAVFAVPAFAQDMTGGTCDLISPASVNPGDTGVVFEFYVCNNSTDTEWTAGVYFTFPDCFTVVDGTYDDGGLGWVFLFSGVGTNVASFDDGDGGYGEIYDGDCGTFYVTVDVGDCPAGDASVHWLQQGDIWGNEPHFVEGDVPFTIGGTAADESSWSSMKALY